MKYVIFVLICFLSIKSFSQERKIYITQKTASELSKRFRMYDSVKRELFITKRELMLAKRKIVSFDSTMDSTIVFMDSVYGQKIFEQRKIISELKKENSIVNRKIRRNKFIVILISIGFVLSIIVK